jgi:hypothetical protein
MNLYNEVLNADGFSYDFKILLNKNIYNDSTPGEVASNLAATGLFIIESFNNNFIMVKIKADIKKQKHFSDDPTYYSSYVSNAIKKYLNDNRDIISQELEYNAMPFTFDQIILSNIPDLLFNVTLTNNGFMIYM